MLKPLVFLLTPQHLNSGCCSKTLEYLLSYYSPASRADGIRLDYDCLDAFTFAFSSAATAGFSIFSDSAGSLKPLTQWIIVIFMMIAGVNYALYEQLSRGKFKKLFNDEEFRWYPVIQIAASILYLQHLQH